MHIYLVDLLTCHHVSTPRSYALSFQSTAETFKFTSATMSTAQKPNKAATRDPNAPKRNKSAYLLYQCAMREQFREANPGMSFGQLAKYTSAMYAEMPPADKEGWQVRAAADKERYLNELSLYVPPPGYDARGDAIVPVRRGGGKRNNRDQNAPKRNMSAYLLYQNAMREQFKIDNPGMTFGQLSKYTSHMYRSLTTEEKNMWESRAAQDKVRYDTEMAAYVPPPGFDASGNLLEAYQNKRGRKKNRDPNAPKRAKGSYVFFTQVMRPKVMEEFPDIKFVDLGTIMGERWRALAPEERKEFQDLAEEDKERFNKEVAEYNANKQAIEATRLAQEEAEEAEKAAAAAVHHEHAYTEYDYGLPHDDTHDPTPYYG